MNGMDVSSLFLIEDGADSEEDSGFFSLYPSSIAANSGDNEDDAVSCNCDTASICGLPKVGERHEDDQKFGEFCGDEDDRYGSDRGNSTMWMSDAALECLSPFPVEDEAETRIGEVNVNELEDRQFWEICMAVGYP